MPSVNYVAAGSYNLTTTAVEGQTKVTTDNAESLGFYVVFQEVKYTSKGEEKTQSAGKFGSSGFESQTKVSSAEGDSGTNGIITFSIKESMTLKLTDSNGKGFAIVETSGANSITSGETKVNKFTSEGAKTEQNLTLLAGQYKLYGNTSSGSCKIASLVFTKVE